MSSSSIYAYDLTGLTGRKKNAERTFIVATVEVNRFTTLVVAAALALSVPVTIPVAMMLGQMWSVALVIPVALVAAGLILVDQRSKGGLQLRRYKTLLESRKVGDVEEVVTVCGVPLVEPVIARVIPQFVDGAPQVTAAAVGTNVKTRAQKAGLFA